MPPHQIYSNGRNDRVAQFNRLLPLMDHDSVAGQMMIRNSVIKQTIALRKNASLVSSSPIRSRSLLNAKPIEVMPLNSSRIAGGIAKLIGVLLKKTQ